MTIERMYMGTFESDIPEQKSAEAERNSSLFLRVSAPDESARQRAVVLNAFLMRVDSDPTPSPYDSIPLTFWRSDSEVTPRTGQSLNSPTRSYYEGRTGALYFNNRPERGRS